MQLGRVEGSATATLKHASLQDWPLLLVQPLMADGQPDGAPVLVINSLGARRGDTVLLSSDGKGARELVRDGRSPVRWFVMGIPDS
jgi:ethanolamine utilization protein EutN